MPDETPVDAAIAIALPTMPVLDPQTMSLEGVRASLQRLPGLQTLNDPRAALVRIEGETLEGPAGALRARVYRIGSDKTATVVLFHGGGWVAGDLDTVHLQALRLALETGAVVVSVDYRRAPETPFPGTFEDALYALKDVAKRIDQFGGDISRVAVAGESAGGNLAAAAAIAARDVGIRLAGQLLVYPATDLTGLYADDAENARYPSRTVNAHGYFIETASMHWFSKQYLNEARNAECWWASPLRAPALEGVAPAVVCTAWFDPLRDEGRAYAQALNAAGVKTQLFHGVGLIHGYFSLAELSEAAAMEARSARASFKRLLSA